MEKHEIHSDSLRRFEEQPEHIEVERKVCRREIEDLLFEREMEKLKNNDFEPGEL